jgi:predicted nucleic acid-binding protein
MINRLNVEEITRDIAAAAGALRQRGASARRKKRDLTVDAVVAAVALKYAPSAVVTSDVDDLSLLCSGADIRVIHPDDLN